MRLPSSDIRRVFAYAMAAGLCLGVFVYGFVRLVEKAPPDELGRAALHAALVGLLFGLALCVAAKLALRQAAYDLHYYAVELTETSLPEPVALTGDDVVYMRETLSQALGNVPRLDELPRLAQELGQAGDLAVILDQAARQLALHLPIQGAIVFLLDGERRVLSPAATWGGAQLSANLALDLEETAIGRALLERRFSTYSGLQVRELLPLERGPEALTLFCLPLTTRGQPFGTLGLLAEGAEVRLSEEQRAFARAVAELLTLAAQSSVYRRLFERESERLVAFEQLGPLLAGSERIERALEQVLRIAAKVTDSVHGSLLLLEADESGVRYRVTLKEGDVLPLSVTAGPILKHGLAGWALRERRADIVEDTERDARWLPVPGLGAMRSVLVVPLLYGERALGVLTLADSTPRHYSRRSLALASALAAYAITILARMQYEEMVEPGGSALARRLFEGHVDQTALSGMLSDPTALARLLGPQTRVAAVLYVGLSGLERLNGQLSPEQILEQIVTPYLAELAAIVHAHHGYIAHRDDGGALALFGYPDGASEAHLRAVHAALAIQAVARRLRGRWRSQSGVDLALSVGGAMGEITTGVVGDERYRDFVLLGGAVRDATRLQQLARPDEVLLANQLAAAIADKGGFQLEALAALSLAENQQPQNIYRLAAARP